jgi:hypothetical protein
MMRCRRCQMPRQIERYVPSVCTQSVRSPVERPGMGGHELNPGSFTRDWRRANVTVRNHNGNLREKKQMREKSMTMQWIPLFFYSEADSRLGTRHLEGISANQMSKCSSATTTTTTTTTSHVEHALNICFSRLRHPSKLSKFWKMSCV